MLGVSTQPLTAQGTAPETPDTTQAAPATAPVVGFHIRTIRAAPSQLFFDAQHRTATVTLTNAGNTPVDVTVHPELGYSYLPGRDTALFPAHETWKEQEPRDTLLVNPGPQDHFLGPWLSGLPAQVHLNPGEQRTMTVRLTPPPGTPNGEYYARLMFSVVLPRDKKPQGSDVKQRYALPVKGPSMPPVQDSVWAYYRQGPQRMGLKILQADAQQDTTAFARQAYGGAKVLRVLVRYHLLGSTHFDGRMEVSFQGVPLPDRSSDAQDALTLYRDGIIRLLVSGLPADQGTLVVRFLDWQQDMPAGQRVPFQPAEVRLPFTIH